MDLYVDAANKYAGLIAAGSTLAIAILTIFLWFENRYLRKAGIAPNIVAYLSPDSDGTGAVEFILANVGRGPAFNVSFQLSYDEADFEAHRALLVNDKDRMPISVLPQGDKIRSLFGIGFELYGNINGEDIGVLKPFKVQIEYVDSVGRKNISERIVDIRQFAGLRRILQRSSAAKIAKSLENIENHLSTIARQSGGIIYFTNPPLAA